jgi:hypothetical protein
MPRATFESVPYVSGDTTLFWRLIEQAKTRCQRIAYIGDSQETNPGGAGTDYIHRLNSLAFHMCGAPSESVISVVTGAQDQFLVRSANYNFTGSSPTPSNYQMAGKPLATMNGTSEGYGVMLRPTGLDSGAASTAGKELFFPISTADLRARIFFAGNSSGPNGARIYYQPIAASSTPTPNYYADVAATHLTGSLGLTALANTVFTSYETPTLPYDASKPNPSITIQGWDGSAVATGLNCAGVRYRDANRNSGMVFDTFSVGGTTASDFRTNHVNAYNAFRAYGPWDAICLSFGTNETSAAITEDQFKQSTLDTIAMLRNSNWQQSNVPIVLISDPNRSTSGTNSTGYATFLRNSAIFAEIAQETNLCVAVNGMRLMAEAGYDPAIHSDGVHPNATYNTIRAEVAFRSFFAGSKLDAIYSQAFLARQNTAT